MEDVPLEILALNIYVDILEENVAKAYHINL